MLSIIIPFYNEEKNLPILIDQLIKVLELIRKEWEIILVDDGSDDNFQFSTTNFQNNKRIKLVRHKKRLGKGQALKTGIENARGKILVFMDADLQDDPNDLPKFLKKIEEGYDFVNGVRINRQENWLVKLYSRLAAFFLKTFLHSPYSDINCGFKAFKKEVLREYVFYGNNFRFFPLVVFYQGFKVTEVPVANRPRLYGQSKFGVRKIVGGIFDMVTAYFLFKFSEKPLHFFGLIGGLIFLIGFILSSYLAFERIFFNVLLYRRPILFLGVMLIIVGVQIVMTGIIGELMVYLYQKKFKS